LRVEDILTHITEGKKVANTSDSTFREIYFDKETKYFIYLIQGVESLRDRKLLLTWSDLKSKDWKIV
jgi:hypothetical protein